MQSKIHNFIYAVNIILIGAILTSFLFSIGRFLLGQYLGNSSFGSTYGAAGSLVVILAWVYYAAQILFFGAEFTQVYARRYGTCIVPTKNAIPLSNNKKPNGTTQTVEPKHNKQPSSNLINRLMRYLQQTKRSKTKGK